MARRILTDQQVTDLLDSYRNGGVAPTRRLSVEYGVSPNYVLKKLVRKHGVTVGRPRSSDKVQPRRSGPDDPRWARARAIGPVVV